MFNNGIRAPQLNDNVLNRTPFVVITSVVLLCVSVVVWVFFNSASTGSKRYDFENLVTGFVDRVEEDAATTANLLYSIKGEMTEEGQNYEGWAEFLLYSDLEKRFPKIFSLGYAELINGTSTDEFENQLKSETQIPQDYQNYFVYPKSDSTKKAPIKYLHTKDKDLSILLGFDLFQSEDIKKSLNQAIISEQPILSDLISLKSIIPSSNKKGYLLILPVYFGELEGVLATERENYLKGFVMAWLSPETLLRGITSDKISLEIFDGKNSVYNFGEENKKFTTLGSNRKFKIFNKEFVANFVATPKFKIGFFEDNLSLFAFAIALLVNFMWYLTVFLITMSKHSAVAWAEMATADLLKFKEAVDGVSDHVIITNSAGVIIYANKAAEKTTGYSIEEMIGRTPSIWGRQMDKEYYDKFWKTLKTDKLPFIGQLTNKRKSGETYDAELSASPILDKTGEVEYIVGIERDITRQKAVAKMKTEFISLASHQLRTPLSAVKWFGKMLTDGDAGKLTDMQFEYVQKINESNEREIKLINSLLNVSRIESGKILVDPKPTDIRNLVENVVNEIKIGLENSTKTITVEINTEIPKMNVDEDLMRHVYSNLLANAVKYSNEDGKILLKVYVRAGDLVSEITDNGIGIPYEEQSRVFEKFFRASNATKKETDGNGLGLYMAKSIVESSGGKIGFSTEIGKDTTFWFILPVAGMQKKEGNLRMV